MNETATSPILTPSRSRLPLLAVATAAISVAFFCTAHNLSTARMEAYGTAQEVLEGNVTGGKLTNQVGFSLLALLGVVLLARRGGWHWQPYGLLPLLIPAFLAWCLASILWSGDPGRTFKRTGILTLCFLGALGLGKQLTPRELCLLALTSTAFFVALGLGAELSLGTLKPSSAYRFAGTLHPNAQGANCGVLCLAAFCLLSEEQRGKLLLLGLLVLGGVCLMLTKSRTSCVALLSAILVLRCVQPSVRFSGLVFTVLWVASGLLLLGLLSGMESEEGPASILLLGRAEHIGTLTGRTELWEELVPYAQQRPFLGYGYGAFWSLERIEEISGSQYWSLSSAHSAYLEMVLGLGFVGAGILVFIVVGGLRRTITAYRATGAAGHALLLGLMVYALVDGISESDFIAPSFESFIFGSGLAHLAFFRPAPAPTEAVTACPENPVAKRQTGVLVTCPCTLEQRDEDGRS